jgi:hypothetical protein
MYYPCPNPPITNLTEKPELTKKIIGKKDNVKEKIGVGQKILAYPYFLLSI